jgi:hypothetical protein
MNKTKFSLTLTSILLFTFAILFTANSTVYAKSDDHIRRGDCDGNGRFNSQDINNIVAEIFDGDGNLANDAPKGTFVGSPIGCDANKDKIIDAGDISCAVILLDGGKCGN